LGALRLFECEFWAVAFLCECAREKFVWACLCVLFHSQLGGCCFGDTLGFGGSPIAIMKKGARKVDEDDDCEEEQPVVQVLFHCVGHLLTVILLWKCCFRALPNTSGL
jgi:hypothetical protein